MRVRSHDLRTTATHGNRPCPSKLANYCPQPARLRFGLGGPDCKQLSASGTLSAALFILNILVGECEHSRCDRARNRRSFYRASPVHGPPHPLQTAPTAPAAPTAPTAPTTLDCALAGYAGFLSYHVLKSNKYSINAASATSLLITAGGVSEIARNLSTLLRTLAALDENGFDALLFTLAISTLTTTQGLMSLALAWLDIAEKSKSMKKKGGSLNKSKLILRGFMGCVAQERAAHSFPALVHPRLHRPDRPHWPSLGLCSYYAFC